MTEATTIESVRRTRYISLRLKMLVAFTLLFGLIFIFTFYWFFNFATDRALVRVQEDLVDTLLGAAARVNGDDLVALYREGQPNEAGFSDDARYVGIMDWLDTVNNLEPRAWPYAYVQGLETNEIVYIADLWARYDTSHAAGFKESTISRKGFLQGGMSQLTLRTFYPGDAHFRDVVYRTVSNLLSPGWENTSLNPYTDEYGSWVSAYAPVKNAAGEIVGGLGVDFRAEYIYQVRQAILDRVYIAFFITLAMVFLLVSVLSRQLTRPIVGLTKAAERIGEGDYQQDLSGLAKARLPDEITALTQVFQIMVGKVYQREQTLVRQVEELKIEIDEAKRQKQVSEIVDSDFFMGLRDKARDMRNRNRTPSSEPGAPPESAPPPGPPPGPAAVT